MLLTKFFYLLNQQAGVVVTRSPAQLGTTLMKEMIRSGAA